MYFNLARILEKLASWKNGSGVLGVLLNFLQCFQSSSRMEGTLWYKFSCGLRGFHVYSNIWKPKLNEKINITHERGNMYDPNAMGGKIMLPGTLVASFVGHIPKEISCYTRYIVEHGASVDATHNRPSPLIQGGLEIPKY